MFAWLRPHCPVNAWEKAWTERRMNWLVETFGLGRLRDAPVVLPTAEFFPDPYDATEASARVLFDRVCDYMGVAPGRLVLDFFDDGPGGVQGAAGLYGHAPGEKERVHLLFSQLQDPLALVATMAHEVAHALLLGDGRLSAEDSDHEWVTDLLLVFLGLGIFGANSVIRESYARGQLTYRWQIRTQGYLSEDLYGYALALYAWARDERKAPWSSHLRLNVRTSFAQGLRYVTKTSDCLFRPEDSSAENSRRKTRSVGELAADLASTYAGTRISALWDLQSLGMEALSAEPTLIDTLKDSDSCVRSEAIRTLAWLGPATTASVAPLLEVIALDEMADVRKEAIAALGSIGQCADDVVPNLARLLSDHDPDLKRGAARSLQVFGPAAAKAVPALLQMLKQDEELAEEAIATLAAMEGAAVAALPALHRILKSDSRTLHSKARGAIDMIRRAPDRRS